MRKFLGIFVVSVVAMSLGSVAASSSPGRWVLVHSPNTDFVYNSLSGVVRISSNDAWAVGQRASHSVGQPLVEHWEGSEWKVVHAPPAEGSIAWLNAVAASSPEDVWSVGAERTPEGNRYRPLIEHFDGSAWTIVASPTSGRLAILSGVSVEAPDDAWAVGAAGPRNGQRFAPIAEHWDGKRWSLVAMPPSGDRSFLSAIEQTSATDAWAVGAFTPAHQTRVAALTEHWDGSSWQIVSNPSIPDGASLGGVAASSAIDAWAVGLTDTADPSTEVAVAEHWDGSTWQLVKLDGLGPGTALSSVSGPSTSDVWAAGWSGGFTPMPVFEHFNGSRWHQVDAVPPPNGQGEIFGISAGIDGAFGVGDYQPTPPFYRTHTLVESCCS